VRQTLADASRSISEIQPPPPAVGLENALRAMLQRFGADAPVELSAQAGEPAVDAVTEYHIVRIAQEAIANALRHAEGSWIHVELNFPKDAIVLRVADSGPGFSGVPARGSGLSGMRERAAHLKGDLHVRSTPGEGTEIVLVVPWAPA
jgi:signal transduction histidine kinase